MGARIFTAICRHNLRIFHGRYAVFSRRVRRFFMGGTLILPRGYGNVPEGYAVPSWKVRLYFLGGTPLRASLPRSPFLGGTPFSGSTELRGPRRGRFHEAYAVPPLPIAEDEELGDTSTPSDPSVAETIEQQAGSR